MQPTKQNVKYVMVCLEDGTTEVIGMPGIMVTFTNHESSRTRNRQEWDVVEIHLTGKKRDAVYAES